MLVILIKIVVLDSYARSQPPFNHLALNFYFGVRILATITPNWNEHLVWGKERR
ncbi:hypothetical protein [Nostoc sp. CALU 546]|uniref:hypothetical protein n=1 Tax=Nostoc sp. CALU 546 TaxID=1867241 RepID=UPI003B67229B